MLMLIESNGVEISEADGAVRAMEEEKLNIQQALDERAETLKSEFLNAAIKIGEDQS